MQVDAALKGEENKLAYTQALAAAHKSQAEIVKSQNGLKEAALDHAATVEKSKHDFATTLLEAETKRAALASQAKQLRGMGI